jgi:hypothetical protein
MCFAMESIRLDEVSIFGDKLTFLIPHEWVQGESDDDHYLYHSPETDSGWLRVSLITVRTDNPDQKLRKLFADCVDVVVSPKMHNLVERSEKHSLQDGANIHLYYWKVGNVVPPDLVQEALFSFTILSDRQGDKEVQETVALVGQLVSDAIFEAAE